MFKSALQDANYSGQHCRGLGRSLPLPPLLLQPDHSASHILQQAASFPPLRRQMLPALGIYKTKGKLDMIIIPEAEAAALRVQGQPSLHHNGVPGQ